MIKTKRKNDMRAEQELGAFLDKYLYERLKVPYERANDIERQLKGIDVVLGANARELKIDEKAALGYINVPIKTFAFEISFINAAGNLHQGWLFNDDLETEYYMLVYPNATTEDTATITAEDFNNVECLFVNKQTILDYIGLGNKEWILAMDTWLRNMEHNGKFEEEGFYDFKFFVSQYLKEKPINILISKNKLMKMATNIYIVNKNKLNRVK